MVREEFLVVERNNFFFFFLPVWSAQRPMQKATDFVQNLIWSNLRSILTSFTKERGLLILNQTNWAGQSFSSISTRIYKINGFVNSHSFYQEKMVFRIVLKKHLTSYYYSLIAAHIHNAIKLWKSMLLLFAGKCIVM